MHTLTLYPPPESTATAPGWAVILYVCWLPVAIALVRWAGR